MSNIGKWFRNQVSFVAGAARTSQMPKPSLPEVAFVGRSNVGKSSLINSLCDQRNLAKVSHTPGRTQQINFFSIAGKFLLVDLPGYGFAQVPKEAKIAWEKLITAYLSGRETLLLVNVLIDARRGFMDSDLEVLKLLSTYSKNVQIVFTKTDKIKLSDEVEAANKKVLESLGYSCNVIYTSNRSRSGVKELQHSITKYF